MAVTLNTDLQPLMFSSQVPDISITVSDDNEAEVMIDTQDVNIFSAVHFPYGHNIDIHDVRSVIEYYLRDRNISHDTFLLRVKHNDTTTTLATFQVLYLEQHFTGDVGEFLRNNFLTTMSAKLTSPKATEFLHFFIEAGVQELITYQVVASVEGIAGGEPRIYTMRENCGQYNYSRIYKLEITYEVLMGIVESPADGRPRDKITVHAYSVHAGQRAFTFYVQELEAVTTQIAESERSIAVTNRISTFYNQRNEKKYEVESSGLTYEQAQWIEQLFYSHDVRMGFRHDQEPGEVVPEIMPKILITDFTCEISDADGELNSVKFTFQFADRRTYLQTDYLNIDSERIFTEPYGPAFQ